MEYLYSDFPKTIKENHRFCLYGNKKVTPVTEQQKRQQKIPINPYTLEWSQPNNPDTFSDFNTAYNQLYCNDDIYIGLGIRLSNNLCCIDLDHCLEEIGSPQYNQAMEIVDKFNSYTEVSLSGTGLHIFFIADLKSIFTQNEIKTYTDTYNLKNSTKNIECYSPEVTDRYIAITGEVFNKHFILRDCTDIYKDFVDQYLLKPVKITKNKITAKVKKAQRSIRELGKDKLLEKIKASKNGEKFTDLYEKGNWEKYYGDRSHSEARWWLLHLLTFWTALDYEYIYELFTESELYKQSEKLNNRPQLVENEINKVINSQTDYYIPKVDKKDIFTKFLESEGVNAKYNILTSNIDYTLPDKEDYNSLHDVNNNLPTLLRNKYSLYKSPDDPSLSTGAIAEQLKLLADMNHFQPVREYLKNIEWDGKERFNTIYEILGVTDQLDKTLIEKWFYQTIMLAFNDLKTLRHTEGVLILQGSEGIGKSSFFERITPRSEWFLSLDKLLDTTNKDRIIDITSYWIVEIGEIDQSIKANKSDLKAFITQKKDRFRAPYDRSAIEKARMTSLCGTTNSTQYLNENTGWRRWWSVEIKNIDFDKLNNFCTEENLKQFWIEVYLKAKGRELIYGTYNIYSLTKKEKEELRKRNLSKSLLNYGEDELLTFFNWDAPKTEWKKLNATEIVRILPQDVSNKLTPRQLGRTLQILVDRGTLQPQDGRRKYLFPPFKTHIVTSVTSNSIIE